MMMMMMVMMMMMMMVMRKMMLMMIMIVNQRQSYPYQPTLSPSQHDDLNKSPVRFKGVGISYLSKHRGVNGRGLRHEK